MSRWRIEPPALLRSLSLLMGRRRTAPWVVGLDAQQAVWLPPGQAQPEACARDALPAALSALAPRRFELVASSDLAVHWVQAPPAAVAGLAELRQVAQARCSQLFDGAPGHWQVAGDWHARRPFACAALPVSVSAPLHAQLPAQGLEARWHTAWGWLAQRAPALFPADGWSALHTPSWLLLWHCRGGHMQHLASLRVVAGAGADVLAERARRHLRLAAPGEPRADAAQPLAWLDLCECANPLPPGLARVSLQAGLPAWAARDEAHATLALALAVGTTA